MLHFNLKEYATQFSQLCRQEEKKKVAVWLSQNVASFILIATKRMASTSYLDE